jgi:hypothetical protein
VGNPFKGKKAKEHIVGSVRQHQLLGTFGIGSIVDFVEDTVIIAGVDDWVIDDESRHIYNENLRVLTGADFFVEPKPENNNGWIRSKDVLASIFPRKFYCTKCQRILDAEELQTQKNPRRCFCCDSKIPLVASRFVVICENGHIDDFPYSWWAHGGQECPSGKKHPRIKMFNVGGRSDMESLYVQCESCPQPPKPMFGAFGGDEGVLRGYDCGASHPHLKRSGGEAAKTCDANVKTRLRSSSSIYFPVTRSALSIPPWSREAVQLILAKYADIEYIPEDNLERYLKDRILPLLPHLSLETLQEALRIVREEKQAVSGKKETDIYRDEYVVLSRGSTEKTGEYSASETEVPELFKPYIEKIVAVDKLVNIEALCGFTRDKPWNGSDLCDKKIAPLSLKKLPWLPGMKMNGEGIFIKFAESEINEWRARLNNRYEKLKTNYKRSYFYNTRFSEEYIFMHSFAHLLIRQIADVCGYNSASLQEKIYSTFRGKTGEKISPSMYGILIFVATPDSEGSLGGLVSIAQDKAMLGDLLVNMLKEALWCSADPLCATSTDQGFESLNYAACHNCTLLPETSCESRNVFLDRIAVTGLPEDRSIGVMGDLVDKL